MVSDLFAGSKISRKFLLSTSVTIAIIFLLVFYWFSRQQERHIMAQVKNQAIILHKQIVLTRQWVAEHGAVLVPKRNGVASSPFLKEPDIEGKDGLVYTKITPSILTSRLSEKAQHSGLYSFKLANDSQVNPSNKPDELEKEALRLFRTSNVHGLFRTVNHDGKQVLRYVAPLYVTEGCLQCHASQNLAPGDVGGCLSVLIPMDQAQKAIDRSKVVLVGTGLIFAGSLVALLFVTTRSLVFKRIREIRASLERIHLRSPNAEVSDQGDELKEIAQFCYLLDEKMKNQHEELERRIQSATRDLSETNKHLAAANEELENLSKAKSDFLSDISHELRTPLTSIKGAADILARKASCDDPEYLDIIKRNTDHLIKTVVDFLDYSKIESGQLELHLHEASLSAVAQDAVRSQKALAQKRSITLTVDVPHTITFAFDEQRIYQVLMNLLSNAIKFSPENGNVTVGALPSSNHTVHVYVQDEGPGIEERYQSVIFEKFYQIKGRENSTLHHGSSGIGLAICKGLVEAHRGRIWVESELGKGSKFVFSLPMGKDNGPRHHTPRGRRSGHSADSRG